MPRHPPTQANRGNHTTPKHRFAVGEMVRVASRPLERPAEGRYKIISQLPGDSGEFSYRVKNTSEPHERVVRESQLTR